MESVKGYNLAEILEEEEQSRLVDRSWKMKLGNVQLCIRVNGGDQDSNIKPGFVDRGWGFREGKLIKTEKSVKRQGEDYSDIKKNNDICTNMDGCRDDHTK